LDFKPIKICFDATGLGEDQAIKLVKEFPNAEPIKFTHDEKYKMVLDLRQEFENLNIVIPNSKDDIDAYYFTQELLKELNEFTLQADIRIGQTSKTKFHSGKYDDCVISLALANHASQNLYGEISLTAINEDD
jgi:hypothetical protein